VELKGIFGRREEVGDLGLMVAWNADYKSLAESRDRERGIAPTQIIEILDPVGAAPPCQPLILDITEISSTYLLQINCHGNALPLQDFVHPPISEPISCNSLLKYS
jgi:hypothetical protein